MSDKIYKKLLSFLILFQPLFDCITSIMVHFNHSVTIGVIIKLFLIILCTIYLVFIDRKNRKINLILLSMLFVFCVFNIICNQDIIKVAMFEYANYMVKYVYLIIVLYFFIRWFENGNKIDISNIRIPIIIISLIFFIALITNTSFNSYTTLNRKGICGWFNSANELGALLCLFFPISIYNAFHNSERKKIDFVLFLSCAAMLILVGTKTGLLGFVLVLLFYIIYRLITIKKFKLDYKFITTILVLIIPFMFFNNIPAIYNTKLRMESKNIQKINSSNANTIILSGRDNFEKKVEDNRKDIKILPELFGKSYLKKDGTILIVERDILDIRYMCGIVGMGIFLVLIIYLFFKIIKYYFKNLKKNIYDIELILCLLSSVLTLAISYISGHVLLSPSVSTFLILVITLSYNKCNTKNIINNQ